MRPDELLRKKLEKRTKEQLALTSGVTPPSLQKTPSQKRSENAKRKAAKKAGAKFVQHHCPCDCWKCPKEPCGGSVEMCEERSMVHRCKKCGQSVRHRVDETEVWEYCPVCIARLRE